MESGGETLDGEQRGDIRWRAEGRGIPKGALVRTRHERRELRWEQTAEMSKVRSEKEKRESIAHTQRDPR